MFIATYFLISTNNCIFNNNLIKYNFKAKRGVDILRYGSF